MLTHQSLQMTDEAVVTIMVTAASQLWFIMRRLPLHNYNTYVIIRLQEVHLSEA